MDSFTDKVAVITGGASGIGFAVAEALGKAGAKIVIADIEQGALDAATAKLVAAGIATLGVVTDVSNRAAMDDLAEQTWGRFGGAHIVMHNAGVAVFGPVQDMTHQDWKWSIDVNLWGPVNGVAAFLPRMLAEGQGGHMVFTASFAGLIPNKDLAPYNVTKAGVVALAESLRKDLRGTGIGTSVLCPMRVTTNIDRSARNRPTELGGAAANRTYTGEELAMLHGRTLDVEPVAALVLDAILRDRLYIHTHKEAASFIEARATRILAAMDAAL